MTNPRIDGAADTLTGKAQSAIGRLNEVKGKARDAYGRVIDELDGLVEKAPADLREPARTGLDFARRKPLLTTGIVAGLALLLSSMGRRR
jgi:uncharacterized protein YjbJ (UPF0337 family)